MIPLWCLSRIILIRCHYFVWSLVLKYNWLLKWWNLIAVIRKQTDIWHWRWHFLLLCNFVYSVQLNTMLLFSFPSWFCSSDSSVTYENIFWSSHTFFQVLRWPSDSYAAVTYSQNNIENYLQWLVAWTWVIYLKIVLSVSSSLIILSMYASEINKLISQ